MSSRVSRHIVISFDRRRSLGRSNIPDISITYRLRKQLLPEVPIYRLVLFFAVSAASCAEIKLIVD